MRHKNSGLNGSVTRIAGKVKIEGTVNFEGQVVIEGTVVGKIDSKDLITIYESGNVESTLKVKDAVIEGNFSGDMIATGTVRIKPTVIFSGNLIQKKGSSLIIEKGGRLKGKSFAPGFHEINQAF
jgi:cytoskeletal protein CcmA (bactofilin family)